MKCKGILQEQNKAKDCWLPANSSSLLQLCRRCHFHRITHVLDTLTHDYWNGTFHPENEYMCDDPEFLHELLHPAREQAFLHLLSALYTENKPQFRRVVAKAKENTVFPILIQKRIQAHVPGPRCQLYREFMKDIKLYKSPDHCWSCIVWSLTQTKHAYLMDIFTKSYLRHLEHLTHDTFLKNGSRVFVDFMTTLYLVKKDHILRIFIDHCFHVFPIDDVKSILLQFFQEPCMLFVFFQNQQNDYLPLPLRDEVLVKEFCRKIKGSIKQKTDIFKEELVIKTWHPDRLFPWCLDITELEDFGISSGDRILGRYHF